MPMMPKRVKFRKSQRGKMKGNATRGNKVAFGEYGLQTPRARWINGRQIEAGRVACTPLPRAAKAACSSASSRTSPSPASRWKRDGQRQGRAGVLGRRSSSPAR